MCVQLDTEAETDTDTDTDMDTEADTEADTDTETDTDTEADTETEAETDTETDTEEDTETETAQYLHAHAGGREMNWCDYCNSAFKGKRRFCNPRCKKLHECMTKGSSTFLRKVLAPLFQKMIRAEWAALTSGFFVAVVNGRLERVRRYIGQCVCVTCGKVDAWDSGIKGMHTGHFVASRRTSILLDEDNVAPQCSHCNYFRAGAASDFRLWMESQRGQDAIEYLTKRKTMSVQYSRNELVDMWFEFHERLQDAKERMK